MYWLHIWSFYENNMATLVVMATVHDEKIQMTFPMKTTEPILMKVDI